MKIFVLSALFVMLFLGTACNNVNDKSMKEEKPASVELRNANGSYRLFVNDELFFVKGAGVNNGDIALLAEQGANAIRTWSVSEEVLNEARGNGLMVMMGLSVAKERHGFDYNDEKAVKEQFDKIKQQVLSVKDHPALLGWGIGNELNLRSTNLKVWDAVEEIAAFIHEVDGKHPVTTMLAGIGKREVDYIREHCPSIDFISIQLYGSIEKLPELIRKAGYSGPYLITEWGATGHWEVPATEWNAPIENTSTEKARDFKHRYESIIHADSNPAWDPLSFCGGRNRSVHLPGTVCLLKMEKQPSWMSCTISGKGSWPENRAPKVEATLIIKPGMIISRSYLEKHTMLLMISKIQMEIRWK